MNFLEYMQLFSWNCMKILSDGYLTATGLNGCKAFEIQQDKTLPCNDFIHFVSQTK